MAVVRAKENYEGMLVVIREGQSVLRGGGGSSIAVLIDARGTTGHKSALPWFFLPFFLPEQRLK